MQKFTTFADAVAAKANADTLAHYVVDAVSAFTEGKDVTFDFLAKGTVGIFCTSLGIKRNWAELSLDEIAPRDERDINVVPLDEAASVLAPMNALIRDHYLTPSENDQAERAILNDFLPEGRPLRQREDLRPPVGVRARASRRAGARPRARPEHHDESPAADGHGRPRAPR